MFIAFQKNGKNTRGRLELLTSIFEIDTAGNYHSQKVYRRLSL